MTAFHNENEKLEEKFQHIYVSRTVCMYANLSNVNGFVTQSNYIS